MSTARLQPRPLTKPKPGFQNARATRTQPMNPSLAARNRANFAQLLELLELPRHMRRPRHFAFPFNEPFRFWPSEHGPNRLTEGLACLVTFQPSTQPWINMTMLFTTNSSTHSTYLFNCGWTQSCTSWDARSHGYWQNKHCCAMDFVSIHAALNKKGLFGGHPLGGNPVH